MSGWQTTTLGDIFEISSSKRVLQSDWKTSGVPFYRAREVVKLARDGEVENELFISEELFREYSSKYGAPEEGDLMVSAVGTLGACYVVRPNDRFYYKDASVLRFKPKQNICSSFFQHAFRTTEVLDQVHSGSGSTVGTYTIERANLTKVRVPPLPEQRRIAAILDKADALRTKRREALAQLDRLATAIFVEMFGDPVTNPNGIEKRSLVSIAEIATGSTPSRSIGEFYEGTIPWIKTTEVIGGEIFDTEEKLTNEGLKAIRGKLHPEGSIIVAMYGQGQTRGRCGLLRVKASCNQACGVIKPSAKFDSVFMFQQLQMAYERLRALGRGGNQENLNLQLLGDFEVLVPPSALQAEYVTRSMEIHALKANHRSSLTELHSLFTSLQHRAFRGEL